MIDWLIVWSKIELFWFGAGHKDFDLTYLEEAYTTEHWLVRIYRSVTCYPPFGSWPVFIEDPGTWGLGGPGRIEKIVRQNSKNFNKHWAILIFFSFFHSLTCYHLSGSGTVLLRIRVLSVSRKIVLNRWGKIQGYPQMMRLTLDDLNSLNWTIQRLN